MRIILTVGHGKGDRGGYDPGAVCGNFEEFVLARQIAKKAAIYYTATYDEPCDLMNYEGDLTLQNRIDRLQNRAEYDFVGEVHLNAGGGTGTEVYYYHGSALCKRYADAIAGNVSMVLGIPNRGAKVKLNARGTDYFGIIRATAPPAVLIETGFIDHHVDCSALASEAGQMRCAVAIADGIAGVRGQSKKLSAPVPTPLPIGFEKGRGIALTQCDLYLSYDAAASVKKVSGTYYLYDGKCFGSRYRICKTAEGCGGAIANVVGYLNKGDIQ